MDFLIMPAGQSGKKKSIWLKMIGWLHILLYLEQGNYYRFLTVGSGIYGLDILRFWSNAPFTGQDSYLSFSLLTWHPRQEQLHLGPRNLFQQVTFVFLSSASHPNVVCLCSSLSSTEQLCSSKRDTQSKK